MPRIDASLPTDDAGWETLHEQYVAFMRDLNADSGFKKPLPTYSLDEFRPWVAVDLSQVVRDRLILCWRRGYHGSIAAGHAEIDQSNAARRDARGNSGRGL